jgi:hypothetical protein
MRLGLMVVVGLGLASGAGPSIAGAQPVGAGVVGVDAVTGIEVVRVRGAGGQARMLAVPAGAHGEGVVVSGDGVVITAHRVVLDARVIVVRVEGQAEALPARVVHADPARDLAVLVVDGTFASVGELRPEQRDLPLEIPEAVRGEMVRDRARDRAVAQLVAALVRLRGATTTREAARVLDRESRQRVRRALRGVRLREESADTIALAAALDWNVAVLGHEMIAASGATRDAGRERSGGAPSSGGHGEAATRDGHGEAATRDGHGAVPSSSERRPPLATRGGDRRRAVVARYVSRAVSRSRAALRRDAGIGTRSPFVPWMIEHAPGRTFVAAPAPEPRRGARVHLWGNVGSVAVGGRGRVLGFGATIGIDAVPHPGVATVHVSPLLGVDFGYAPLPVGMFWIGLEGGAVLEIGGRIRFRLELFWAPLFTSFHGGGTAEGRLGLLSAGTRIGAVVGPIAMMLFARGTTWPESADLGSIGLSIGVNF